MRIGYQAGIPLLTLALVAALPGRGVAQAEWRPSAGHVQVPIWPRAAPNAQALDGPEFVGTAVETDGSQVLVAGKPWVHVNQVSRPTMTVYSPPGRNTGAAVVVFPGGGYTILAIDLEGSEACEWLTSRGITCVLLKYR
ncbi:MAG: alpha/beta hydrolase, partial [Gemmatimonadota bacterium]